MIKKTKRTRTTWSPEEITTLRELSKMGASNKEIAKVLGRTPNTISFQKAVRGIRKNRDVKFTGIRTESHPISLGETLSPILREETPMKDSAKEMTRVARQIARENGKRITMAMFFIEDLD